MGALGISEDVIDPGHKEVEICMYLFSRNTKRSYISHLISLFTIQNLFIIETVISQSFPLIMNKLTQLKLIFT